MARSPSNEPILTLEPLLEAVREGVEGAGWELSGLQKTTSYEFEGRWAGDSSRSAYLFFHREDLPDWVSIDVFLDETTRGLRGNLALVVEGPELSRLGPPDQVLADLADLAAASLPEGYRTPLTLRYRLPKVDVDPGESETEIRFKLHIPRKALQAGHSALVALSSTSVGAFQTILGAAEMVPYLMLAEDAE